MVLQGCLYVEVSLCRLRVCSAFGARAGFDMDTSHIFPLGVLATVLLIGGVGLVLGYLKPVQGVRHDFLSAPWLSPPCQGVGFAPSVRVEALRFDLDPSPFP